MTSLIRYQLAAVLHAQRYLGPLLFFIAVLCVFTINDQGPLTGSYVVSAGSLLIVACWLTVTVVNHEDPVRRAMTAVHAGGPDRVLSGETASALLAGVLLMAVGTVFPILSGDHHWTGADLAAGLLAQLAGATRSTVTNQDYLGFSS